MLLYLFMFFISLTTHEPHKISAWELMVWADNHRAGKL